MVWIPALHVKAFVSRVGVNRVGAVQAPDAIWLVGWYAAGAAPGSPGTALLTARAGSGAHPGLFTNLQQVRRGAAVYVTDVDGRVRSFHVTGGKLTSANDPRTVKATARAAGSATVQIALMVAGPNISHHSYRGNYLLLATA